MKTEASKVTQPGFAFVLPWSFDFEGGGVGHAVVGLADQCVAEAVYRPIAVELDWQSARPREDQWRGIPRIRLRLHAPWSEKHLIRTGISYLLHLPVELYRLLQVISAYDLHVINRQFPGLDAFSFVFLRWLGLFRGKNVFTFQGTDVRLVLSTRGLARRLWKWMLHHVDSLVFVSKALKEEFLPFDPKLESRCLVVYNGVNVEAFKLRSNPSLCRTVLFSGNNELIVSVGRFEYRKGHDLLVKAFHLVLQERNRARLAIIGRSGPTFDETRKLVNDLGLADHVALLTDIPYAELPSVIRRADVFVLCSRWEKGKFGEGFPLALVESGALELPVVSTLSTGCDEIIHDGQTGRLVAVENPTALAGAIVDLLGDRPGAQRMAGNLHNLVCEQFTWNNAWSKYRAIVDV